LRSLTSAVDDSDTAQGIIAALFSTLPAYGASLGYELSAKRALHAANAPQSLLRYDVDSGFHVRLPGLAFSFRSGERTHGLALMAGQF